MSTTSAPNAKAAEFFVRLPKCEADGSNWAIYKNRFAYAAAAAGLANHLLATHTAPSPVAATTAASKPDEVAAYEAYLRADAMFTSGEAIIKQAIAATIPDSLFLRVMGEAKASGLWEKVKTEFETKSRMVTVDLASMQTLRVDLVNMGADPGDDNFTAIILGSLSASYEPYLAALTATSTLMNTTLTPDTLISALSQEYDRRSLKSKSKKSDNDVAFAAGERRNGKKKSNVECYNCHKKGHVKAECWAPGGGKEGQGPKGKGRGKGKGKGGESANAADDIGGVWMAQVDDRAWTAHAEQNVWLFRADRTSLEMLAGVQTWRAIVSPVRGFQIRLFGKKLRPLSI